MKRRLMHLLCDLSGHRLGRERFRAISGKSGRLLHTVRECWHGRYWGKGGPTELAGPDLELISTSRNLMRVRQPVLPPKTAPALEEWPDLIKG